MAQIVTAIALPPLLALYAALVFLIMDTETAAAQYALIIPVAYILGSVPWGFLIGMAVKGVDIRQYGSGKTGTSNVLRTAGGPLAALALVLDLSKGLLAVLLARVVAAEPMLQVAAGLAVLAGHNWSVFLGFKGGRGIAPGLGGLLIMQPVTAGIAIASFIPITLLTRYLSLGSILSVIVAFLVLLAMVLLDYASATYLWYAGIGGAIILWQHRDNIHRLVQGTERRLGQRADRIGEAPGAGAGPG